MAPKSKAAASKKAAAKPAAKKAAAKPAEGSRDRSPSAPKKEKKKKEEKEAAAPAAEAAAAEPAAPPEPTAEELAEQARRAAESSMSREKLRATRRARLQEKMLEADDAGAEQVVPEVDDDMLTMPYTEWGHNALHTAAVCGLVKSVQILLKRENFDTVREMVTALDCRGRTPLHWAACTDMTGAITASLAALDVCPVNHRDVDGHTALEIAQEWGMGKAAAELYPVVARRAEAVAAAAAEKEARAVEVAATIPPDLTGFDAGIQAMKDARYDDAMALVTNPSWPFMNEVNERGCSLLHLAAVRGLTQLCEKICERDNFVHADLLSKDRATALHLATAGRHAGCVRAILESGRFWAVNERDLSNNTALHLAALRADEECYFAILAHEDCDPCIPDGKGKTAPELAYARGMDVELPEMVQLLQEDTYL